VRNHVRARIQCREESVFVLTRHAALEKLDGARTATAVFFESLVVEK
jgi:hypothetical protein